MKKTGIERNRWIDPIEDFVRQHGRDTPRWAVFLTYNFDLDRFARSVVPSLSRRGRRFRIVALSDQATMEQSLRQSTPNFAGAVNLHPIRCLRGGIFHPKLALLRAGKHVRACFGSANITNGGLGANLELWTATDSPELLGGIAHFLCSLAESADIAIDKCASRSLQRALSGLVPQETDSVWSSLQEPFVNRLAREPELNANHVTVISPLFASEGGIKLARRAIKSRDVSLYTDAHVSVPQCHVYAYSPPHVADQPDEDAVSFPSALHAKAYIFQSRQDESTWAWMGSANFTSQALTKSVSQGGNVELMVRARLPKDEYESLQADLGRLFEKSLQSSPLSDLEQPHSQIPEARATILACELVGSATALRLRIHTLQRTKRVLLSNEGQTVPVTIKNRLGILEGAELRCLLPKFDGHAAKALVIYQLLGDREIPVVVNVPHVPPSDGPLGSGQASLDSLLDDLLGRVTISRPTDGFDDDHTDAIDPAARTLGLTPLFAGVFLLALVGNSAELINAVRFARKDQMDLAVGVTVGAGTQVALLVAPLLVLAGWAMGWDMNLLFSWFELLAIGVAVAVTRSLMYDGSSSWIEGLMLLAVYVMLGIGFYYLPADPSAGLS